MSWTIKIKHTRPNTGVDWYRVESDSYLSDSDNSHVESTYRDTEKLASASVSLSENELELTKTFVFDDEDSWNEFWNDSRIQAWISARNTYHTSNSITIEILQDEAT